MKTSTSEGKHGTQWTAQNQLDDLDFADELTLLSHTHEQMQIKTASVAAVLFVARSGTQDTRFVLFGTRQLDVPTSQS
ncbi:unnamed protein product [Schistosoma margrebowiei]|uniref:Uncharacterized protein n=1 Tax=Schistosoma margrebowiei TaxID=48269 RepID=A0A183LUM1_9TREM|nr:unnamed protein product [Schistosoma margrebowiei]